MPWTNLKITKINPPLNKAKKQANPPPPSKKNTKKKKQKKKNYNKKGKTNTN